LTPRVDGIVSHWDVDGIASAALVAHYFGIPLENIRLSSTSRIHVFAKELLKSGINHLFILDLNPNFTVANKIVSGRGKKKYGLTWVDHHQWHSEALELVKAQPNCRVIINPNAACTALLVAEKLLGDVHLKDAHRLLVEIAIDDDTFSDKLQLTRRWRILLRWGDWSLRYRVLEDWIDGIVWPEWAEIEYERVSKEYEKLLAKALDTIEISSVGGIRVLFAYPDEKVHPGDLQRTIESSTGQQADMYVFIYDKGVSFRSRVLDVSLVAKMLGGGGHSRAAGARVEGEKESIKNSILKAVWRVLGLSGKR